MFFKHCVSSIFYLQRRAGEFKAALEKLAAQPSNARINLHARKNLVEVFFFINLTVRISTGGKNVPSKKFIYFNTLKHKKKY